MKDAIIELTKSELFILLGGVGTIGIILTGISVWLGGLISERLKQSWQRSTNRDVENLRATLNKEIEHIKADKQKDTSIVSALLNQSGQINHKVLEKRITSVDAAWDNLLKIRATMPPVVYLTYTILLDSEVNNQTLDKNNRGDGSFGDLINDIDMYRFTNEYSPFTKEIQKLRPFLSQKLSLLLYVYGAVIGRLVYYLKENYSKGKAKPWREDNGTNQLLNAVLNTKEMEFLYNKDNVQSLQQTLDLMEVKILDEMNKMLSGHMLADDAIALTRKWSEVNKATN